MAEEGAPAAAAAAVAEEGPAPPEAPAAPNPRAFLDVDVDGEREGRIVVELFRDAAPRTADNFLALCTGEKGIGKTTGLPLHFKGCPFHRIIRGFMAQSGDFSNRNGTGGESIYGEKFEDEPGGLALKHEGRGMLSMANAGPNTNGSQFFITFASAPHLDGKHCVFGRVLKGWGVLKVLESLEADSSDRPKKEVIIADCGAIADGADDGVVQPSEDGDVFPDWPQDLDEKPKELAWWVDATETIKASGTNAFKRGEYKAAVRKYRKALRFLDRAWESKDSAEHDGEKLEELRKTREAILNNSALCKLKLNDFTGAVADCDFVLSGSPANVKALFRRGQAYMGLNELTPALEDFAAAHKIDPNDAGIKKEYNAAKQKMIARREKERLAYSKIFG